MILRSTKNIRVKTQVNKNVNEPDEKWGIDKEQLPADDARSDCVGEEMA